jgi:ATP-binding region ATPase domain protein
MSQQYRMTVDLNVLDHLGINLYSNLAAVLTEIVANAWDADAEQLKITIDENMPCCFIEITDDGKGMTVQEMNDKYLKVGYRRRQDEQNPHGKITAKGRAVMGRKGLGKLSLFSIANNVTIHSIGKDGVAHGLTMDTQAIKESIEKHENSYNPTPVNKEDIKIKKGTFIRLENINRSRMGSTISSLKKRLARRFSIFDEQFTITINDEKITLNDRDDLAQTQFLWRLEGTKNLNTSNCTRIKNETMLPNQLEGWRTEHPDWKITGWLGTAELPKQLNSKDMGNLNTIIVLSRGRLFHENILDKINDGRLYTKYLTGQIEANFLDDNDQPDIATSDRQRIQEADPRYQALLEFMRSTLNSIEKEWSSLRKQHDGEAARREIPALQAWVNNLPEIYQQDAYKLINNLSALSIDDREDKKTLYRHGILAFERMRLRQQNTAEFLQALNGSIDGLIRFFASKDAIEDSLYGDIVRTRLETIKNFHDLVDSRQKEKVLQQYLFEHLWLLDPSWERVENTQVMESRLIDSGIKTKDMTREEALGRVDIAYRTTANKHLIIELKKADRKLDLYDLAKQGTTYVEKLKKILLQTDDIKNPNIEVIFVIGTHLDDEINNPDRVKDTLHGVSPGSRIVHYDALISNAQKSYQDYLAQNEHVNKLDELLSKI